MATPRRPRPTSTSTTLPTLAMLLAVPAATGCSRTGNTPQPEPTMNPQPLPPIGPDAAAQLPPPVIIPPGQPVPVRLGGAVAPVTPHPAVPHAAAPSAAPAPAVAPTGSAGAAAAPSVASARAVQIVHNHPPGVPCTPVSEAQVRAAQSATP